VLSLVLASFGGGDDEGNGAPICVGCGVTAIPGHHAGVPVAFVCDNPDCESYGEAVR
jgi:hypothetical protein